MTGNIIKKKGWPKKEAIMKANDQKLEKIIWSEIEESWWKMKQLGDIIYFLRNFN